VRRHFLTIALLAPLAVLAVDSDTAPPVLKQFNVAIAMRDGVHLSANIYRPGAARRYPTILIRTPYDKGADMSPNHQAFVAHGYAVVVQDVRGRYASGGKFEPINQEINDGDDTLNWIAAQPWSDGNVGMTGGSYVGIAQWKAAMTGNPHLKAIFPYVSGDDDYRDRFYSPGGAMKLGHRLLWIAENMRAPGFEPPDFRTYISVLPVRSADSAAAGQRIAMWQLIAAHPDYDTFWQMGSVRQHLKEIHVPVFSAGGWYDNYVESDLDAFSVLSKRGSGNHIMIGPWPHNLSVPFERVSFGKEALVPLRRVQLEWFDRWLKDKQPAGPARAPVRIFVMGLNKWRDEEEWPLTRAKNTKFYFASGGHAKTANGDGELQEKPDRHSVPDTYTYDPQNPVATLGGAVCCDQRIFPWGPQDQRPIERRPDVLVYSTPPLATDIEVTGAIKVVLYASSSAPDTDFTGKLVDVFPNGEARNLTDGILRARYRESLEKPKLMQPGEVYRMTIDAGVTSNVFRAGHRIRLEISSSNFPRFDRNPNTGTLVADEIHMRPAVQQVYHDRERHSYLLLPVVPAPVPATQLTSAKPARYVPKRTSALAR
jgi:uncharacterized protein